MASKKTNYDHDALRLLVSNLSDPVLREAKVIPWSSPIPNFGDIRPSKVATLGLNPSNREFVDVRGVELNGSARRFHTLKSLGLDRWSEASEHHIDLISISCREYFSVNPYDTWFKELNNLLGGISASYYGGSLWEKTSPACHLDLIPYATSCKWTELTREHRLALLSHSKDSLAHILRDSNIGLLVLNGMTVVDALQKMSQVTFDRQAITEWTLPRKNGGGIVGYAFTGHISKVGETRLKKDIKVLGFNHNIQSSYGVTTQVKNAIKNWITLNAEGEI
jgi:hypothetical protein